MQHIQKTLHISRMNCMYIAAAALFFIFPLSSPSQESQYTVIRIHSNNTFVQCLSLTLKQGFGPHAALHAPYDFLFYEKGKTCIRPFLLHQKYHRSSVDQFSDCIVLSTIRSSLDILSISACSFLTSTVLRSFISVCLARRPV